MQLKEQFVSAEGEYKAFEDQEMLATASDSNGEVKTTTLGPSSAVEQIEETVLSCTGEERTTLRL